MVAVSGGPDSVALLRLLDSIRKQRDSSCEIVVAHCNHLTRAESPADEAFVRELAASLGYKFHSERRDPGELQRASGDSEESFRNFRYEVLLDAAKSYGARYLVTGHTQDDQVETLLFRVLRGTGIGGLAGIPKVRVNDDVSIVRPLLTSGREELIGLLRELDQPFRIDESNADSRYSRNFIRNELLPLIRQRFGQVDESVLKLAVHANEFGRLMDGLVDPIADSAQVVEGRGFTLAIAGLADASTTANQPTTAELQTCDPLVVSEAIRKLWRRAGFPEQAMTREKWESLTCLVTSDSSQILQLPGKITASVQNQSLLVQRASELD